MNKLKLNLNLLRSLEVMLHEKNITQAGKKLFLTQSAMSNALNQCRELFHDELLIRGPAGLELTPKAKQLQEELSLIIDRINAMLDSLDEFDPETSERKFVIGFNDRGWASQRILPNLIDLLENEAPNVTIDVNYVDYEVRTSLKKNEAPYMHQERYMDLIIGFFERPPEGYDLVKLYETEVVCAAHKGHPYLKNPTLKEYLEARHLVVSPPFYGTPTQTDVKLEKENARRDIAMRLADVYQALMLLPHTPYLATLPKEFVKEHAPKGIACAAPPFKTDRSEAVSLIWDQRQTPSRAHTWLRKLIERSCSAPIS